MDRMQKVSIDKNIEAFALLSKFLKAVANKDAQDIPAGLEKEYDRLNALIPELKIHNPWFIEEFVRFQLNALAEVTTEEKLKTWIEPYRDKIENSKPHNVGVIMAGNIALVGFHDFLTVLITGNRILVKASSKDSVLPVFIADVLKKIAPHFDKMIEFQEKLSNFDAVIATGSDNTARYFEYYFGKVPHIIRKNRNSIAILNGNETKTELDGLADDILLHFGLGCRNVSKIYIPENYDIQNIFEAMFKYKDLINHHKYANNYEYNRAIYLLNKDNFFENGFFIVREGFELATPISVLNYERYSKKEHLGKIYKANEDKIQIVVSNEKFNGFQTVKPGNSQVPELYDYEDGINTLDFLTNLDKNENH